MNKSKSTMAQQIAQTAIAFERRRTGNPFSKEYRIMLRLAVVFLVVALIAAFMGYGGVEALAWEGAKILFFIFLVLAVLSFLGYGYRRRSFLE